MWGKDWNRANNVVGIRRDKMMLHDTLELPAPPGAQLRQDAALVRHGFAHDDIEGAHAIGCDQQQAIGIHGIDITDLALGHSGKGKIAAVHQRHTCLQSGKRSPRPGTTSTGGYTATSSWMRNSGVPNVHASLPRGLQ
jgi:hypothetical protein